MVVQYWLEHNDTRLQYAEVENARDADVNQSWGITATLLVRPATTAVASIVTAITTVASIVTAITAAVTLAAITTAVTTAVTTVATVTGATPN